MIYRIAHKTRYEYADAVPLSHNLMRARPRNTSAQSCRWHDFSILPVRAIRGEHLDYFGNHVSWLSVEEPHTELTIDSHSEVEVRLELRPELSQARAWEQVAEAIRGSSDVIPARQFTFDSLHVRRSSELAAYALSSFPPGRSLLECAFDLTKRIHVEFKYLPGSTKIGTPSLEVLQHRRGVCQDFAHLQIACFRSLGLAARYVSGYLVTTPPPGKPRLTGVDATHAWVSLFDPDFGWVDFDPTNGVMPLDSHITVAWGRDYDDVGPIRGILIGGHRQKLDVSVDVVPIESGF
ncbi:MAG TPA: transglutaminase family protein [Candidatus Acidoferrales bacterium]|nr:transglutaminase family protein [Candidatus Acidoferrales bacterium]